MCGSIYNVIDYPLLPLLLKIAELQQLEYIENSKPNSRYPGQTVTTILPHPKGAMATPAIWWLKLVTTDKSEPEFIPDRQWKSFNCRANKILSSPMHRIAPVSRRSLIICQGFHEWQPVYHGNRIYDQLTSEEKLAGPKPIRKQCYLIQPATGVCYLACLSKKWAENCYSTGNITLGSHAEFRHIHKASFPLALNSDELGPWLNPEIPTADFSDIFMQTTLRHDWKVTPVNGPEFNVPMGESENIRAKKRPEGRSF